MFAVIFEVQPRKERFDDYLELASNLKPEIEKIDGFIDNERFAHVQMPGHVLSLSTWRDEKSVIRWRTLGIHHDAQVKGRSEIFSEYHLRVGEITADSHVPPGHTMEEQHFDETRIGISALVTISELAHATESQGGIRFHETLGLPAIGIAGVLGYDVFESLTKAGKFLLLTSWTDSALARAWHPTVSAQDVLRHRHVRIIRDYGMRDRREAPQYYPPADID